MPVMEYLERNAKLYGDEVALVELNPAVADVEAHHVRLVTDLGDVGEGLVVEARDPVAGTDRLQNLPEEALGVEQAVRAGAAVRYFERCGFGGSCAAGGGSSF